MKSQALRAKAEDLYVRNGNTFAEIAASLDVAERTLRMWANEDQEYPWSRKRELFRAKFEGLDSKIFILSNMIADSLIDDFTKDKKVDSGRIYGLKCCLEKLDKAKAYIVQKKLDEKKTGEATIGGLTEEKLEEYEQMLGLI